MDTDADHARVDGADASTTGAAPTTHVEEVATAAVEPASSVDAAPALEAVAEETTTTTTSTSTNSDANDAVDVVMSTQIESTDASSSVDETAAAATTSASLDDPNGDDAARTDESSGSADADAEAMVDAMVDAAGTIGRARAPRTPQPMPPIDPATGRVLTSIAKSFVYGSIAFWRGKPISELEHTHQWTVYLRCLDNDNLSYFIESVTFHLHSSFAQPVRVITAAPFQVTETGWGEFAIVIVVTFIASARLPPLTLTHPLKLFPPPNVAPSTTKPVVAETYDEFVFHRPTADLYHVLTASAVSKVPPGEFDEFWTASEFARDEHQQLVALAATAATIKRRIERERRRLFQIDRDIVHFSEVLQSAAST